MCTNSESSVQPGSVDRRHEGRDRLELALRILRKRGCVGQRLHALPAVAFEDHPSLARVLESDVRHRLNRVDQPLECQLGRIGLGAVSHQLHRVDADAALEEALVEVRLRQHAKDAVAVRQTASCVEDCHALRGRGRGHVREPQNVVAHEHLLALEPRRAEQVPAGRPDQIVKAHAGAQTPGPFLASLQPGGLACHHLEGGEPELGLEMQHRFCSRKHRPLPRLVARVRGEPRHLQRFLAHVQVPAPRCPVPQPSWFLGAVSLPGRIHRRSLLVAAPQHVSSLTLGRKAVNRLLQC